MRNGLEFPPGGDALDQVVLSSCDAMPLMERRDGLDWGCVRIEIWRNLRGRKEKVKRV